MGQRAKLSDRNERELPTWDSWTDSPVESWMAEDSLDRAAEREARAILAETEPRQEQGMSGHWPCGRPNQAWQGGGGCYDESGYLSGAGWGAHTPPPRALPR